MKRTFFLCIFIFCCFCVINADQYDKYFDNAVSIQVEKPGTLGKLLGKTTDITRLQLSGELSDKDMKALAKQTNLKRLDLRKANIEHTQYFPTLPALEVLFFPSKQHLPVEYMDMVPSNTNLKVLMLCSFLDKHVEENTNNNSTSNYWGSMNKGKSHTPLAYIHFSPFKSLRKVVVSDFIKGEHYLDYKNFGVEGIGYEGGCILVDTVVYLCDPPKGNPEILYQQFKARSYEERNGYLFYIGTEAVDFSSIQAVRNPKSRGKRPIIPQNLDLKEMVYIGSGYFNDSEVENIIFSSTALSMENGAFRQAQKLNSIRFTNSLKQITIPSYAFADCPKLETIVFDCPVIIESAAFSHSNNIKKIIFNAPATIKENGLQYVDEIIFNDVPASLDAHFTNCKNITIPKTEGAFDQFVKWGVPAEFLINPLANLSYDIIVTEPGNILNFLPFDKLDKITSLIVTGRLYETDLAIIKQCTNLRYLNLANSYISESPTSQERRQKENEMWANMAQFAIIDAQVKEATGEYKKREAKQQATEAILAAAAMQANNPEMPDCFIPVGAFEHMLRLQEVVLPSTVKQIRGRAFDGCSALQKVDLGNALEEINRGAFANTQLLEIKFPNTLKSIHVEAFENVKTLTMLDFSNCTMTTTYGMIYDYYVNHEIGCLPNVTTLYMPKGMKELNMIVDKDCMHIKDLYIGADVNNFGIEVSDMNLHFQTEVAPEFSWFGKVSNCVIYVPKTANITSYFAKYNNNGNKIVQE